MSDSPGDHPSAPNRPPKQPPWPKRNPETPAGAPNWRFIWWYIPLMLFLLWFWQDQMHQMSVKTIPYSQFKQYLADGEVAECKIEDTEITGRIVPKGAKPKASAVAAAKQGGAKPAAAAGKAAHPAPPASRRARAKP